MVAEILNRWISIFVGPDVPQGLKPNQNQSGYVGAPFGFAQGEKAPTP